MTLFSSINIQRSGKRYGHLILDISPSKPMMESIYGMEQHILSEGF